jgi:hypothetical protein
MFAVAKPAMDGVMNGDIDHLKAYLMMMGQKRRGVV